LVVFGGGPQYSSGGVWWRFSVQFWWGLVEVLIAVLCSDKPIHVRPESVCEKFSWGNPWAGLWQDFNVRSTAHAWWFTPGQSVPLYQDKGVLNNRTNRLKWFCLWVKLKTTTTKRKTKTKKHYNKNAALKDFTNFMKRLWLILNSENQQGKHKNRSLPRSPVSGDGRLLQSPVFPCC